MKLVTKHGKKIEVNPEFHVRGELFYMKGELSTAYMDEDEICIFLKDANNLLNDQDRIEFDFDGHIIDLIIDGKWGIIKFVKDQTTITIELDLNLAKLLYYRVFDPEHEFLKNLRDYGVKKIQINLLS